MSTDRKKILSAKFRTAGSSGKKIHVMSRQGHWVVFKEGANKVMSEFSTKRTAIINGKKILNTEEADILVVHREDGSVERLQTA